MSSNSTSSRGNPCCRDAFEQHTGPPLPTHHLITSCMLLQDTSSLCLQQCVRTTTTPLPFEQRLVTTFVCRRAEVRHPSLNYCGAPVCGSRSWFLLLQKQMRGSGGGLSSSWFVLQFLRKCYRMYYLCKKDGFSALPG